ncbi:platelet-activating factor acetylhydrolase [Truncatella angustata]|uniref:1-alkyl-2-acetylglycerophosphocholine esterase n=1 Tax=Truncatella angustata TaxID=152316 RepID=A0A9P8USV8_9PEZI|nr:platelet-activating factor acetylhydrolase [Truncatella angustata]KAH6657719.1 platelet-activating factor acetylhydrolase [Truncatella angustata]
MTTPEMEEGKQNKGKQIRITAPAPPRTIRERMFHALPAYSGPYSVGTMEIELPAREPKTFSHFKREGVHALRMDTVLLSIYYPCDISSSAKSGHKPSRATWLPRPRVPTCRGYAKFLNIPHMPVTAYIAATTMWTKVPALRNAKLAGCRPGEELSDVGGHDLETSGGDAMNKPKFPVIIFSHGLGGSRMCYSSICGELASNGFIVVAVEHRDGSGARSYVNIPPSGNLADWKILDNTKSKNSYVVDYIWPKDNAQDTSPHNQRGVDHDLRDAQIEMRMAEIAEAYYAMELINSNKGDLVLKSNLRKKGNVGSSSKGLENVDWADWVGRMHLHDVTIMGHSFGGATCVQLAREEDRFPWVGQSILLDAWGPAVPIAEGAQRPVTKPLLTIGSEAFMHWSENFESVLNICKETRDAGVPCWMMTVKGSTHLSQTDFAVLYSRWMSWFAKNVINPRRAVLLTTNSSLEFLKKVLPSEQTSGSSWVDEGILETKSLSLTDSLPSDNKPAEKWMAARLRIPNEFRLRIMSWFRRTPKTKVPTDASGKPLTGLVTHPLGDEVWMHVNPSGEAIACPQSRPGWNSRQNCTYSSQCVVA